MNGFNLIQESSALLSPDRGYMLILLTFIGTMLLLFLLYNGYILYGLKKNDRFNIVVYLLLAQAGLFLGEFFLFSHWILFNLMVLTNVFLISIVMEMIRRLVMDEICIEKNIPFLNFLGSKSPFANILLIFWIAVGLWEYFIHLDLNAAPFSLDIQSCIHNLQGICSSLSDLHYSITVIHLIYYGYYFLILLPAIYIFIQARRKKDVKLQRATVITIIFGFTNYVVIFIQYLLFQDMEVSQVPGVALGMTFLFITFNTDRLVKNREERAVIETDLKTATKIQQDALPKAQPAYPFHEEIEVATFMKMAKSVGGDFYDYFEIDNNHVCFLIADVSGKGIPAALYMMVVKTVIKGVGQIILDTGEIFRRVNEFLTENNEEMMFATAWIGILQTDTLKLQYTNAGHNYPFLLQEEGELMLTELHGPALGASKEVDYQSSTCQLSYGNRLFLYTDGLTEAHNKENQLFGEERVKRYLDKNYKKEANDVLEGLCQEVEVFSMEVPQFDDVTMMYIELKDPMDIIDWREVFV